MPRSMPRRAEFSPNTLNSGRLLAALLIVEVVATALDLSLGPWSRMHWEEQFNARAGLQLLCGHWDRIWELQYRSFCGGCTAEAVLSIPGFRLLGPTVGAWKLVPVAFHLVVTLFGTAVARLAGGNRAALAWLLLMIAAPGFYRDLSLTGWGNHAESSVFPLGALLLVAAAARVHPLLRSPLLVLGGAVAGLGFWFCHTSAHALPALGVAAVLASRWQSPAFLVGLPLGAWPWWAYQRINIDARHGSEWLSGVHPAPLDRLVDWFTGPMLQDGLWSPFYYGDLGPGPELWWGSLWFLGVLGAIWAVRARSVPDRGLALFGPVAIVALVLVYALRFDLWQQLPDAARDPTLNIRYLSPLIPMLWLGAALSTRLTRWAWLPLGGMVLFGLVQRLGQWEGSHADELAAPVLEHRGWPDRTVPVGDPPQQLPRMWYRPADIEAAWVHVFGHTDPLQDCALDHWSELGRRLGLASVNLEMVLWPEQLADLQDVPPGAPARRVAASMVLAWVTEEGGGADRLDARLEAADFAAPGWGDTLGYAAGRRAFSGLDPSDPNVAESVAEGVCAGWEEAGDTVGGSPPPACGLPDR